MQGFVDEFGERFTCLPTQRPPLSDPFPSKASASVAATCAVNSAASDDDWDDMTSLNRQPPAPMRRATNRSGQLWNGRDLQVPHT